MKIFKLMYSLMKKHISFVLLSITLAVFTVLSNVGMLATSSVLISKAALHPEILDLMVLIVAVRFFGISRGVLRYLERIISHNTTFKILSSLRKWFYKSFNENYSENNMQFKTGNIYTRLVNDVDTLKDFFLRVLYPFVTAVLTGIVTALFLAIFSRTLSIVYAAFYLFSGFILPVALFKFNTSLIQRENKLRKEINIILLDIINGILELSVYSFKDIFSQRYNKLRCEFSCIQNKKNTVTVLGDNIYSFSVTLLMALALVIGTPLVSDGRLSGVYFAMLPLSIMASFEALLPMPNLLYRYSESSEASNSIFSIIRSTNSSEMAKTDKVKNSNLLVKQLSVKEADSENYILKDISFELPAGKKIAIVGISGSGKSSLLKTILGFMGFSSGEIKLGNSSYSALDIDEIREQFVYIEQNPYIFNTTIKENVLIANPASDEDSVIKVLEMAQLHNFVNELPEELSTVLGQFGSRISGGEKQRLAIARALLKNSPIVLLDEPTAGLDVELEKSIIVKLHDFIKNKSCIWVTHRLVGMDKMDEIIVLDKGKIIEKGTHHELINLHRHYYKLWKIQNNILNQNLI